MFSYFGLIICVLIFIPELVYVFTGGLKAKGKILKYKVLELVLGVLLVLSGAFPVFQEGYTFDNIYLFVGWIIPFVVLLVFYYLVWIKYFKKGYNKERKDETLNEKFIVSFPEAIYSILLYGITACFTFNLVMLALTVFYTIVKVNRIVSDNVGE